MEQYIILDKTSNIPIYMDQGSEAGAMYNMNSIKNAFPDLFTDLEIMVFKTEREKYEWLKTLSRK